MDKENMLDITESKSQKEIKKLKWIIRFFIVIFALLVGIICLYTYIFKFTGLEENFKELMKINTVLELYKTEYYNDFELEDLIDGALLGISLQSEDKYGGYLSSAKENTSEKLLSGKYKGIGITYNHNKEEKYLDVVDVIPNSPADKAGIKKGDKITGINGESITEESIKSFGGMNDENVPDDLKISLELNYLTNIEVVPAIVEVEKLNYTIKDNIGYVKIHTFVKDTVPLFENAIKEISKANVSEIIFDLRDNPGGDVESVVPILDSILGECRIMTVMNKENEIVEVETSDAENLLDKKIPIKILVNSKTASASELFTMVLQEKREAIVYGETTYGKSTVLSCYGFKDGSLLIMSTGVYTPESGRIIEGVGIEPDVKLSVLDLEKSMIELRELNLV